MYCPYCGTKLNEGQLFCHICGESQVFEEDEEIVAQPVEKVQLPPAAEAAADAADRTAPSEAVESPAAGEMPVSQPVEAVQEDASRLSAVKREGAFADAAPRRVRPALEKAKPYVGTRVAKTGRSYTPARQKAPAKSPSKVSQLTAKQLKKSVDYIRGIGVKQLVTWCVGVVAAVLVLVLVIGIVHKANEKHILAVVANDLVYYTNDEATVLEANFDEDSIAHANGGKPAGILKQMSNSVITDRNVLVYLDDYVEKDGTWTLKMSDLGEAESEIIIDTGVYSELHSGVCGHGDEFSNEWKTSSDGSVVYYLKNMDKDGGSLYRYCDGISELVGSRCISFNINDKGDRVCWIACDSDGVANILNARAFGRKKITEQLDTQFHSVLGFDSDLDAVYYTRMGSGSENPYSIYVAGLGVAKERLVAGVSYVSDVSEDGGFFYGTNDGSKDRVLYWHAPGGEQTLVTRTCSGVIHTEAEHGIVIYYSQSLTERIYYMFSLGASIDFGDLWAVDAVCGKNGEVVYIMLSEEGVGRSLYSCAVSSKGIEKPVMISQRCSELLMDEESDTLFYAVYSELNTEKTSLYMWDGETSHLLSDDAYPMVVYDGKGSWAFFTDASSAIHAEESPHLATGTLNLYSDGNVIEVDDNVAMLFWHFMDDGTLVYIKDYLDAFGGVMYIAYPDESTHKVAIDVQAVMPEETCLDSFGR